jgi:hypothetical protein
MRNDQFHSQVPGNSGLNPAINGGMGALHGNRHSFYPYTDPGPMGAKVYMYETLFCLAIVLDLYWLIMRLLK